MPRNELSLRANPLAGSQQNSLGRKILNALIYGPSEALPMEGRYNLLPLRQTDWPLKGDTEWALPGIAAGMVNAFTAPGRAIEGKIAPSQMVPEAMNFAGNVGLDSWALSRAMQDPTRAVPNSTDVAATVYHGSHHKFDQFSSEKIGTLPPAPLETWYRGQIGSKAELHPFEATAGGRPPSFADNPEVANIYATDPNAAHLYPFGRMPKDAGQNGNVSRWEFTGNAFDLTPYQGGHGTQTGMTPDAVKKFLKSIGIESEYPIEGWMAKYGKGKQSFWDVASDNPPKSRQLIPTYLVVDDPYVQEALQSAGYGGVKFKGALSNPNSFDNSIPWDESLVHRELRAFDKKSLRNK